MKIQQILFDHTSRYALPVKDNIDFMGSFLSGKLDLNRVNGFLPTCF
jgi:hypothetical protein